MISRLYLKNELYLAGGHVGHEDVRCECRSISRGQCPTSAQHSESSSHAPCYQRKDDESTQLLRDGINSALQNFSVFPLSVLLWTWPSAELGHCSIMIMNSLMACCSVGFSFHRNHVQSLRPQTFNFNLFIYFCHFDSVLIHLFFFFVYLIKLSW